MNDFFRNMSKCCYKTGIIFYSTFLKSKFIKENFPELTQSTLDAIQKYLSQIIDNTFSSEINFAPDAMDLSQKMNEITCEIKRNQNLLKESLDEMKKEFSKLLEKFSFPEVIDKLNINKEKIMKMFGNFVPFSTPEKKSFKDFDLSDRIYTLGYKVSIIIYVYFLKSKFTKEVFKDLKEEQLKSIQKYLDKILDEHFSVEVNFVGNINLVAPTTAKIAAELNTFYEIDGEILESITDDFFKEISSLSYDEQIKKVNADEKRINNLAEMVFGIFD